MIPQIALSSWVCKYPDEILPRALDAGFTAVEWDLNYIPMPLSQVRRRLLRQNFSNDGVAVRFHLPYSTCDVGNASSVVRQTSLNYLKLNVDLLAELDGDFAVLHFASNEAESIRSTDILGRIVDYARTAGVTVAIENLVSGVTSDANSLVGIAQTVGATIALDIGHASCSRTHNELSEFVRTVGPLASHVHLYGFEDSERNHRPFASRADAEHITHLLLAACPAKWWTCEMDRLSDCIAQRLTIREFIALPG